MANLMILESPSKAATIKGYLGSGYRVIACKGHFRDLPKSTLGVDIDNGFEAHYINIRGKGDLIKEIRKEAKKANKVFLATDPDREGEAIAWHLATVLDIPVDKTRRVTFNEVTKTAVKAGIKAPRNVDMNLVNSQQARRILDRIVGYKLSPVLWKRIRNGLSAGRVQSVAARIIVDREQEIRDFKPEEFWLIDADLVTSAGRNFTVRFFGDENGKKLHLSNKEEADAVLLATEGKDFTVTDVKKGVKHKSPAPPFTTSTLQQEASKKLNFQSSRTMKIAQELYEGVNVGAANGGAQGLITYMRTDSQRVSTDAQEAARELIRGKYGEEYCPKTPRNFKSRNGAQDAHEAIRPVRVDLEPAQIRSFLTPEQYRLYKLIWDRFISSQMESAALSTVTADVACGGYIFRTSGYTVTFPGFMSVYEETVEDGQASDSDEEKNLKLPELKSGDILKANAITPSRHYTEAPPRYTEASLVKFLEEKGIGRPSTFAAIISIILDRDYVRRDGKALVPTPLGEATTELMKNEFADIVDYKFTANMEDSLDDIEKGETSLEKVLTDFWADFEKELEKAEASDAGKIAIPAEETDMICEKCGAKMVVRTGKFGKFAACPNYPRCRNTKPLVNPEKPAADAAQEEKKPAPEKPEPQKTGLKCELCGADLVLRTGRYGSFYACSRFPECRYTKHINEETPGKCPKCGGGLVKRHGRSRASTFYGCANYPACDFSTWDIPTAEVCPKCGKTLMRKKGKNLLVCSDKDCGYEREIPKEDASGKDTNEQ